ncbi:zinc finger, CCHC-type containing protein [Tanacetum coccineum]
MYTDNRGKCKYHETKADPNKKPKVTCWKCGKTRHLKKDCKGGKVGNKANGSGTNGSVDGSTNSLKGRCWFKTYESLNDGSILHMGNESTALVHERGCVDLRVPNKRNMITPYELWTKRKSNLNYLKVWGCNAVIRLLDLKLKNLGKRGIECIFDGYAEHSKAFRFYVIEPNESVSVNSIIESMDAIFDENRFSSVPRPSQRSLLNGTGDTGGTRDEVFDQHSYCFNVEDDPKTFDEAMKSHDVAFWKEAINDEMDSIMGNNTWVLADLPPMARISTIRLLIALASIHSLIINQMDVKTTFLNGELNEEVYMNQPQGFIMPGNENKVDLTKEFLSSRFSIKDMGEADVILGIRINMKVQKYLKKTMDYSLTYTGYSSVLEGYTDASWINNTKDNSSTNGWVFLLGKGAISWASKKQTCITSLIMDSEFIALAAAIKKAEWLKNLIIEIPLYSKPIAPISILCDKAPTLAKPYSQVYNGKSIHLGVSHSMIHELITNGVVSIEFVRSQQNLADHLTKGLARDLVLKSAEGMGLKSNQVTEC